MLILPAMLRMISILAVAILLTSCMKPKTQSPGYSHAEVQAEIERQRQMATQEKLKKQQSKAKKTLKHQERLLRVSGRILEGGVDICYRLYEIATRECVYQFELLDKGPINAYADGKKIYITPAMMNFAAKDEELAYVLAHEYAHNILGHVPSLQTNQLIGALFGAVLDAALETGDNFTRAGADIGRFSHSRGFEQEADYVGLYISKRAGYKVSSAPNFWRKMSIKNPKAIYASTTHPSNPERFIAMEKTIEEMKYKVRNRLALLPELKPLEERRLKIVGE